MEYLLAAACTLFGWWFSTGLILMLNHLPLAAKRWSMVAATLLLALVLVKVPAVAEQNTQAGALLAFGQALVIWGWLEMGYLMGFVTGPSNRACPPNTTGWMRFGLALKTSLYHECSVVAMVLLMVALTLGHVNQVAMLTCVALWLMRWSAKLNLFLGVSNFHAEWLPESQRYLATYTAHKRINPLFPFSVILGTAAATLFLLEAGAAGDGFGIVGNTVVGLLLALGVLEHWFLVLPVQDSKLWQWALPSAVTGSDGAEAGGKEGLAGPSGA